MDFHDEIYVTSSFTDCSKRILKLSHIFSKKKDGIMAEIYSALILNEIILKFYRRVRGERRGIRKTGRGDEKFL